MRWIHAMFAGCALAVSWSCGVGDPLVLVDAPPGAVRYDDPLWTALRAEEVSDARVVAARHRVVRAVGSARGGVVRAGDGSVDSVPCANREADALPLPVARAPRSSSSLVGPIDLNRASLRELESLPRVGPAMAQRIVSARPFRTVDDLARVRGVGPATLRTLGPLVKVEGSPGADAESAGPRTARAKGPSSAARQPESPGSGGASQVVAAPPLRPTIGR